MNRLRWLGIGSPPSCVSEPECNGISERLMACLLVVCMSLPLVACTDDSDGRGSLDAVTRDSAGIRILEYDALDTLARAYQLGAEPIVSVGQDPGGRVFETVVSGVLLPDGLIGILDGGATQEIVLIDEAGRIPRILGGPGQGPGEFQRAAHMVAEEDGTFLVQDWLALRVTWFAPDGAVETEPIERDRPARAIGLRGDTVALGPPVVEIFGGRQYEVPWSQTVLGLTEKASRAVDTVALVDGDPSVLFDGRDPFRPAGFSTTSVDRLVYVRGDRPELRWMRPDSGLVAVTRWPESATAVTDSIWSDYAEAWREFASGRLTPEMIADRLIEARDEVAGILPLYSSVHSGSGGEVWLARYARQTYHRSPDSGLLHHVFGPDGAHRGTVYIPARTQVLDVRDDRVLLRRTDSFGVHSIEAYRLLPPG